MTIVIDANIAAALLLDLSYSKQARAALDQAQALIAPDLVHAEMANTLWKLSVTEGKAASDFDLIVGRLPYLFEEIIAGHRLLGEALRLAIELKHPAYDCFYAALALTRRAPLMTADRKLATALAHSSIKLDVIFIEPNTGNRAPA